MENNIKATVASFHNLPTSELIKNSVVVFWESHAKNPDDKMKVHSTIDLIGKKFDLSTCEKYEIRTGYLSRYNYLQKIKQNSSIEELEEAVIRGEEEQIEWIKRCSPGLSNFVQVNWQECISNIKNPYFISCRNLLMQTIDEDTSVRKAFTESARNYALKRNVNGENCLSYLVEENAWILTLPYLYPNKQIYTIHVGKITDSTMILFSYFEYLRESVRMLLPHFSNETFASISDFRIEYENKKNRGYFVDDDSFANLIANTKKEQDLSKDDLLKLLMDDRAERELLLNIISKMPGHVYWLNNKYVYMGCNDIQAKHLGMSSKEEIVGKTIFDLLPLEEAKKHDNVNKLVVEKGKIYSGEEKSSLLNGFRTYLSNKIPLTNSVGKNVGLLGISIDITERKRAEELQKKLEIQEELYRIAKVVAREVDSPITALKMIEYMSMNKLPEEEMKMLKMAIGSIETAANTLSGLKTVSRAPVGCELPEEERKELDASIANVKTIANTLLQKYIEIQEANFKKTVPIQRFQCNV
ncbi:MAG: PAS domain-containing protein [Endomicrobium sp.]|jgi:PAS domain S-box-containing protein|nr:PAS domain-containing protein [Endomicrobium sp.]